MKFKFSKAIFVGLVFSNILCYSQPKNAPIVENYLSSMRARSGIAMGGIGTGSIELRKDANFYNWSIFNNYPVSTGPAFSLATLPNAQNEQALLFFLVRYEVEGQKPKLKLLQLNNSLQEGGLEGIIYYYPWMSGVEKIEYSARFPFTNITFTDSEMPFDVELKAFSPFIPHDIKNSSLPGIYFNFKIKSKTNKKVDVMLLGTLRNLVGYDTVEKAFESRLINKPDFKFFTHSASGLDALSSTNGQMGLGAMGGSNVSYYLGWEHKHPYYEKLLVEKKLANIDDTNGRNLKTKEGKVIGRFDSSDNNDQRCFSSIAVSQNMAGMSEFSAQFFMTWNFPNKWGAVSDKMEVTIEKRNESPYRSRLKPTKIVGHYYQNFFPNIDSISSYFAKNQPILSNKSHQFVDDLYTSDLDQYVLDQINSNLNTFITSSSFSKSGDFGIREGLTSSKSWGPNSTLDVSLYGSPMIVALFPELQKSMMRTHKRLQTKAGEVNHGLGYDLDFNQNGTWGVYERVDLVGNYIQMVLRDYLFTNDKVYMKEMWPSIKLGIEYLLNKRDLDGDQMPDMHGIMCSYDNFPMYGLASYIQSQWIAALSMASKVATDMGDKELAKKYNTIAQKGIALMESKLWNGSYYNLSNDYLGKKGIDDGCLTDQLIGQWVAHNAGIGTIFNKDHIQKSLESILKKSFMDNSFLRNCSWPATPELYPIHETDLWVDQANTPWTGVELAFASFLIYENKVEDGLRVIKGVDDRYRKAGLYFDHQEFGGHYLRPMSAWSILNAFLGYSVDREQYNFAPKLTDKNFKLFFATPTGTCLYRKLDNGISIDVRTGEFVFSKLNFTNSGLTKSARLYIDNVEVKNAKINSKGTIFVVNLSKLIHVKANSEVTLK